MSGAGWQWAERNGGSAHQQHVARSAVTFSQRAFQTYQDHRSTCADCAGSCCERADELWRAYQDARDEGRP